MFEITPQPSRENRSNNKVATLRFAPKARENFWGPNPHQKKNPSGKNHHQSQKSSPLFEAIAEDMTEEEIALSISTPGYHMN